MRPMFAALGLMVCVGVLTAQGPQAQPPITPTQFAYYSGADLKAMAQTLKSGGQIKWNRIHRGDHDFQGVN